MGVETFAMNGSMIQFLTGVQATCASLNLVSQEARPAELAAALQSEAMMGGAISTLRSAKSRVTAAASGAPLTDAQVFLRLLDGRGVKLTDELAALRRAHDADTSAIPSNRVFSELAAVLGQNVALFPSEKVTLRHGERAVLRFSENTVAEVHYRVVAGKLEITLSQQAEGAPYPSLSPFEPPTVFVNDEPQKLKRGRSTGYDGKPPYYFFQREIPLDDLPPNTMVAFHYRGVTKIVNVEVARVDEGVTERRAPLFDLFHGGKILDLEKYREKVRAAAAKAKSFRDRMEEVGKITNEGDPKAAKAARLAAYRSVEDDTGLDKLSTADTTQLLHAYKNDGQWADVARLYESSPNQAFRDSQVIKEFYIVALNKLGRIMESIQKSKDYINQGHNNGEVWAGLGKAHRVRSEVAYALAQEMVKPRAQRDAEKLAGLRARYRDYFGAADPDDAEIDGMSALTESYQCYLKGYLIDLEYYPGVNAVYNLLELNKEAKAKELARMVYFSTLQAGGKQSTDYWCVTTMLELAVILEDDAEIEDMLPRVLSRVRHDWEADSSLAQLAKVAKRRQAAGRDTTRLDFVQAQLEMRKNHQGRSVAETNPDVAPIRAEEASLGKQVTDTILAKSFHYKGLNSSFIAGNAHFGGQLHDHVVNRTDLKLARDLLASLGLTAETDFEAFNTRVDEALAKMLDFVDPQTGERSLERYHGEHHKLFDRFMQKLLDYSGSREFGDSRTNIFVDLAIGRGDCRQATYTKQLLFDIWRQDRITTMMREAYTLLMEDQEEEYRAQLTAIEDMVRTQLVVMDVKVQGKIRMNGGNKPLMEAERYVLAEETGTIEEHTLNALVRFDEKGHVASLRLKDAFYHEVYPWENLEMNPADILGEGMAAGAVPGLDAEGREVEIPVTLIPTAYAGARDNLNPDEFGQTRLRGLEVAAPTVENLLSDRRKSQALVNQILGLDESGWDVIRAVLAQEIDAAAADAHNVGWKKSKDRDFADPANPFVGWGPKRIRVSDETKAMNRQQLEAHVGASVSEEKYQAMLAAKNGMDITHNLYRLYDEVVSAEADGGNRFAGKNALPLLTLVAYLADWRGREAGTKVGIAQVLAGLMEGADEEGIQMLDRLQALAFKAGELVYGERGVDGEVVEMAPTGRKLPRKARTDIKPYRDLTADVQALDGYTLAPAAKWFARRLGIGALAA